MKTIRRQYGDLGEDAASEFLVKRGFRVLERNFLTKLGEVDIVAQDKDVMVFIEVKRRSSQFYGLPQSAVTTEKLEKIKRAAQIYLMKNKRTRCRWRIDVLSILDDRIEYLPNVTGPFLE